MPGTFKLFGSSRDPLSAGPRGHVTARAPSRRESRLALCARLCRCLPAPRREGEERRSHRATGSGCACAANSCHPVRNKSPKFPESPWAGGHRLPSHLPLLGRVLSPARAPGNRFSGVRGMGTVGGGARAVFLALPRSARGSRGCRRPAERRRRARDARSAAAATVTLARERPAMVLGWEAGASDSPLRPSGGSVPRLAVLPGAGVRVALLGRGARVVRGCLLLTFPLPARSAVDSAEAGPGAPLGAISSLGLS